MECVQGRPCEEEKGIRQKISVDAGTVQLKHFQHFPIKYKISSQPGVHPG